MKIIIPLDAESLGGASIEATDGFEILAEKDKVVALQFYDLSDKISWFEEFDMMYCQRQHDPNTVKVIRKVTDDEIKTLRIPLWIQGDDYPECCGKVMKFVGQINDNNICAEAPEGAKMWWHDAASFYVFTCPECLEVKAVGQQY
jgi:hypothetical protein